LASVDGSNKGRLELEAVRVVAVHHPEAGLLREEAQVAASDQED